MAINAFLQIFKHQLFIYFKLLSKILLSVEKIGYCIAGFLGYIITFAPKSKHA